MEDRLCQNNFVDFRIIPLPEFLCIDYGLLRKCGTFREGILAIQSKKISNTT